MSEIVSKPYRPEMSCERCAFGGPQHAEWCEWRVRLVESESNGSRVYTINPEDWREHILAAKRQWAASTREAAAITNLEEPK